MANTPHAGSSSAGRATIRRAHRDDAFVCAALRLQMDLESGEANRSGFLTEYADYFLAHFDDMPTWVVTESDGTALGFLQTSLVHRAPALARLTEPLVYVAVVFVVPQARGVGLATRMLHTLDTWADDFGVARMMLNTRPKARSLYERHGFGVPEERHLHRVAPFGSAE